MRIFLNMGIVEHTGYGIPMIVGKYGKKAFDIHDSLINVTILFRLLGISGKSAIYFK